jgi:hypothetical protein
MGSTPLYTLPWPELPDVADGPDAYQKLAVATEAAIKTQADAAKAATNKYVGDMRTRDDAVPPATWGSVCGAAWDVPAGRYLFQGLFYWCCSNWYAPTAAYSWLRFWVTLGGGAEILLEEKQVTGATFNNTAPIVSLMMNVADHPGGVLYARMEFGFADPFSIVAMQGSRISIIRIS